MLRGAALEVPLELQGAQLLGLRWGARRAQRQQLVPTDNIEHFLTNFCNNDKALTIHERCFILRCDDVTRNESRRPYMDVELSLKYQGNRNVQVVQ